MDQTAAIRDLKGLLVFKRDLKLVSKLDVYTQLLSHRRVRLNLFSFKDPAISHDSVISTSTLKNDD